MNARDTDAEHLTVPKLGEIGIIMWQDLDNVVISRNLWENCEERCIQ